eukprot:Protomagalhaensia_wolfi_Nauph_80__5139@NODE_549_length_2323_cov_164_556042_g409_i0_p2_GENE_NODE_549_length_2323_cov_164_556042_g409_i0NODE_549_length_2323_cov_164_556042_g409_i0_p2_ORF_typecomplete_len285_score40_58TPR_15/PF13429_6/3_5e08TPR_15/PF13429_6/0_047ANAPC3/PF12895_7/0_0022ANAPC3/PF12895_7/0_043ChAPs/PF09295_10/6_5e07ChAPs/PF09295_10/0_78TPR_19/PF14559_6/0_62TPR_19/PF14559_6/0_043TPR_14/PF13428_6/13TPR_14/PF13428_6/3_1e02TPR_14/PF13428_6/0_87TPR_14/PF13428_6/50TPR_16/PF13432_6/32TPR_16/
MMEDLLANFEDAVIRDDPIDGCKYGFQLMNQFHQKLNNDRGDEFKEKLMLFAHRIGDQEWTQALWKHLDKRHPNSKRIDRLGALALTTGKKIDAVGVKSAVQVLEGIIKADPANASSRRTLLALMLSQSDSTEHTVKLYDDYLHDFPSDTAAWSAFGSFCLKNSLFQEAQTVYEELALVLDRDNIENWLLLAQICTTNQQTYAAFKYYSMALVYEPFNMTALQGIVDVYTNCKVVKSAESPKVRELAQVACKRILDLLEEQACLKGASKKKKKYTTLHNELLTQ